MTGDQPLRDRSPTRKKASKLPTEIGPNTAVSSGSQPSPESRNRATAEIDTAIPPSFAVNNPRAAPSSTLRSRRPKRLPQL
jgi:hypothetical protein